MTVVLDMDLLIEFRAKFELLEQQISILRPLAFCLFSQLPTNMGLSPAVPTRTETLPVESYFGPTRSFSFVQTSISSHEKPSVASSTEQILSELTSSTAWTPAGERFTAPPLQSVKQSRTSLSMEAPRCNNGDHKAQSRKNSRKVSLRVNNQPFELDSDAPASPRLLLRKNVLSVSRDVIFNEAEENKSKSMFQSVFNKSSKLVNNGKSSSNLVAGSSLNMLTQFGRTESKLQDGTSPITKSPASIRHQKHQQLPHSPNRSDSSRKNSNPSPLTANQMSFATKKPHLSTANESFEAGMQDVPSDDVNEIGGPKSETGHSNYIVNVIDHDAEENDIPEEEAVAGQPTQLSCVDSRVASLVKDEGTTRRDSVLRRLMKTAVKSSGLNGSSGTISEPPEQTPNVRASSQMVYRQNIMHEIFTIGIKATATLTTTLDFVMIFVYLTSLWIIPICISFQLPIDMSYSYILTILYAFDTLREAFTRRIYGSTGSEPSLKEWQYHYFKNGLICDLVTTFPLEALPISEGHYLWIIRVLRLYKLPGLVSVSPQFLQFQRYFNNLFGFGASLSGAFPLICIVCVFFHLQACAMFLAGHCFGYSNIDIVGVKDADPFDQYSWALLFAIGNTFPLAYKPVHPAEQWIVLCFVVLGAVLYASVVGVISAVAMGSNASDRLYKQKIDELKEYMKWKDLSNTTRRKILKYYELKYRGKFFEETTLLGEMNESLRMEIAAHNCRELIAKVSFLNREQNDGKDELFVGKIATALVACYFVPGDIIFIQGETGHDMFFIAKGSVSVLVGGTKVASLKEGGFFGEVAILGNIPRTATVQCETSCILYRLTRVAFKTILNEFDDVRAKVDIVYKERMEKIRVEEEARKLSAAKELIAKVEFLKRKAQDGRNEVFLLRIASSLTAAFYCADDVIFNQGEISNDMYFMKSGRVEIIVNGKQVAFLHDGAFFGEVALIANLPRTATVKAMVPCMLYRLTRPCFERITDEFPDVMENVQLIYKERMNKIKSEEEERKLAAARELVSKVTFLQRTECDGRDDKFLLRIANSLVACFFIGGDIVFRQGEIGYELYFIKNGRVDVRIGDNIVATLKEGAFFGEIALLANIPRTATIQASTPCMLYQLSRSAFESILDEFDDVRKRIDLIYHERLDKVQGKKGFDERRK